MIWPEVKLCDVVEILDSMRIPVKASDRIEGPYPYYGANGQQGTINDFIFDEPLILVAEDGGHFFDRSRPIAYRIEGKTWVNNHAHVLRCNSDMDISYLCHQLARYNVEPYLTGSTRAKLTKGALGRILITKPPLDEQRKVAAILDKAHSIERTSASIQKIRNDLLQSIFISMFGDPGSNPMGWEKVKLNQLCSFDKKSVKPENVLDGTNYLGLECIEKTTGNILDIMTVMNGELKSNKFWFDESHILYGKLRPYLNKVALPCFDGICSTDIIPIQPILSETNRAFISYILKNKCFVSFAHERSSGANLPRISPKEVQSFLTIKPPLTLQNRFAEIVNIVKSIPDIKEMSSTNLFSITQEIFL
jgi:restriction endonuclease S subunit